jgi:hypothetical protein
MSLKLALILSSMIPGDCEPINYLWSDRLFRPNPPQNPWPACLQDCEHPYLRDSKRACKSWSYERRCAPKVPERFECHSQPPPTSSNPTPSTIVDLGQIGPCKTSVFWRLSRREMQAPHDAMHRAILELLVTVTFVGLMRGAAGILVCSFTVNLVLCARGIEV